MKYLTFKNFNKKYCNNRYFVTFGEDIFLFVVKWSKYSKSAFLSIYDYNNKPIIRGRALSNGMIIRNNKLPYVFYFFHKEGKTYEPTLNNLSDEFILVYEDNFNEK